MSTVIDASGRQLFRGVTPRDNTGALCRFAVRPHAERVAYYGPTLAGALGGLLGQSYERLDAAGRREARRAHAVRVAGAVQARLSRGADLASEVEEVLGAPKTEPVAAGEWDASVPLVLVESWFAPFAPSLAPTGRVLWLRPEGEWEYVVSLRDVGCLEVHARA